MGCEVCVPSERGYTVYFAENESTRSLNSYFRNCPADLWKLLIYGSC